MRKKMETALFAVIIAPLVNITGKMQIAKISPMGQRLKFLHTLEKTLNEK